MVYFERVEFWHRTGIRPRNADYVPLLVLSTALHLVPKAEHGLDGPTQRLRTFDHKQTWPLGIQAPLDQVFEQCLGNNLVLGRSFPKPEKVLPTF